MEHPPTYTLGVRGSRDNLLVSQQTLLRQGVSVHRVKRGGDITYHGPGQLVGYPIVNVRRLNTRLGNRPLDVRGFVERIETSIIDALARFGVGAWRNPRYPGVWVDHGGAHTKIAAIGVHINYNRVSRHGFALNVDPDMRYFDQIIPCGIQEHRTTSMASLLKRPLSVHDVLPAIIDAFGHVFQYNIRRNEHVTD